MRAYVGNFVYNNVASNLGHYSATKVPHRGISTSRCSTPDS